MQIHLLSQRTRRKKSQQIGRGGKRGKTSGRGTKGQRARAGHRIRPQMRDEIKRIPKLRGRGVNINTPVTLKASPVNLSQLEVLFKAGEVVSPKTLLEKGVIKKRGNVYPSVKILATGNISKKITISGCRLSKSAKEKIEKAGGSVA